MYPGAFAPSIDDQNQTPQSPTPTPTPPPTPTAPPTITIQPHSQLGHNHHRVTFTAAATGKPKPTVQWFVSSDHGKHFKKISGATSPSYSFVASTPTSHVLYEAVFTNSAGSATTQAASLTVSAL
jgi:hypothetical protein